MVYTCLYLSTPFSVQVQVLPTTVQRCSRYYTLLCAEDVLVFSCELCTGKVLHMQV